MLIKSKNILTALVVAGITAFASSANAATYLAGDLLLGFRATGGTGASSNLIVNLGQADTVFRDATVNNASVTNIGALLTSTYGAGWDTRADLFWGVAGVRTASPTGAAVDGDPVRTNYLTAAQTSYNPGVQTSTPWTVGASGDRTAIANAIVSLANNYTTASGTTSAVIDSSTGTTWSTNNNGLTSFTLNGSIEGSFGSGAGGTSLDLYRILNSNTGASPTGTVGTGSYEGTFTLSNAGLVGFNVTAAAVPEPSRALLGGLGLAGVLFRRRRVKQTA